MGLISILSDSLSVAGAIARSKTAKLKWRFSKDGKKFFHRKNENEFYTDIVEGDPNKSDIIRTEKQDKINKLKNGLSLLLLFMLIPACSIFSPEPEPLTTLALKENEKTYRIENKLQINTQDGLVDFNKDWHIVHSDILKDMNDNQDTLIAALPKLKMFERIAIGCGAACSVLFIMVIILLRSRSNEYSRKVKSD